MQCPKCGSLNTKANVLGIPRVFGLSPNLVGGLWLIGGISLAMSGLNDRRPFPGEPDDRIIQFAVGIILAITAVIALISRKYRCIDCKTRFNFGGPPSAVERLAKAVKLEARMHFQEAIQEYNSLSKDFPESSEAEEARRYASHLAKRIEEQG
jgi:DNA-directed RNA polymerase subunit RPC12/RpoP